ncbi:hypothetical protein AB1Y20_012515 [Prymnesium parvum]|uniref:RING-type E3 ubiquitin transferase n=1 Tax=Prymnesium parvum TaxID=97485 RepID=A0AB34IIQ9_PRYPA
MWLWLGGLAATPHRLAEADELLRLSDRVISGLPPTGLARDGVRAFRAKLAALRGTAETSRADEWDALLAALLEAEHHGLSSLTRLLAAHSDPEPRCEPNEQPLQGGRRLLEAEAEDSSPHSSSPHSASLHSSSPHSSSPHSSSPHSSSPHASSPHAGARAAEEAPPPPPPRWREQLAELWGRGGGGEESAAARWWRALLDSPPPWERDCDCCFPACPPAHHCISQADGLFLACRGESVGEIMQRHWIERPLVFIAVLAGACAACVLWLRQQVRILYYSSGAVPAKACNADDGDDENHREEGSSDASSDHEGIQDDR